MRSVYFLVLLGFVTSPLVAQEEKGEIALPRQWHGHWQGELQIMAKAKKTGVPMSLKIEPMDDGRYRWEIGYGVGEGKQLRKYLLEVDRKKPGRFVIDEQNGIRLAGILTEKTLQFSFIVGKSLLVTRYELVGLQLRYETAVFQLSSLEKNVQAQSLPPVTVQRALLSKAKSNP